MLLMVICPLSVALARTVTVTGNIYDRRTTKWLPGATVKIMTPDSTVIRQTTSDEYEITTKNGDWRYFKTGKFVVELKDSITSYILEATMDNYEPLYYNIDLTTLGKKEFAMKLPPLYMGPMGKTTDLDDVVVKATKIKFYHKGDTVVYNADAFQLPEGSMLDALIEQLPGVEIKDGGKIYVNGKYVESMLLNGKDFFKGNQQALRENLGAYTVKSIEVYDKYNDLSRLMGEQIQGDSEFVMDVKLKKDYMTGFMGNVEGGYGTHGKYMGRLFAMLFTNNASLALYGNVNNVNDMTKPSSGDGYGVWMEPSPGVQTLTNGGIDYSVESPRKIWTLSGNANVSYTDHLLKQNQFSETYIPSGNTYQTSIANNRTYNLRLSTNHMFRLWKDNFYWRIDPDFMYSRSNSKNNSISATFNENVQERYDLDRKILEALYQSDNPDDLKQAIVNRNNYIKNNRSNSWRAHVYNETNWKIPKSPNAVTVWIEGAYSRQHDWARSTQLIDMGYYNPESQPNTSLARQNTTLFYPAYDFYAKGAARYYINSRNLSYSFCYEYRHEQTRKTNEEFLFESIAEHQEALIPDIYTEIADLPNTSRSKQINNMHELKAQIDYATPKFAGDWKFQTGLSGEYHIVGRHLDYNGFAANGSGDILPVFIPVSRVRGNFQNVNAYLEFTDQSSSYKYFRIRYGLNTVYASMLDMIDLPNTSDPLNLYRGNPDLKDATRQDFGVNGYAKFTKTLSGGFYSNTSYTSNAVIRGYTYFPETGVREYRTTNMSGVINSSTTVYANKYFGSNEAFMLYANVGYNFNRYGNMIGVEGPSKKMTVFGNGLTGRLNFQYKIENKLLAMAGMNYGMQYSHSALTNTRTQSIRPNAYVRYTFPLGFEAGVEYAFTKTYGLPDRSIRDHYHTLTAQIWYKINSDWTLSVRGHDLLNVGAAPQVINNEQGFSKTFVNTLPRFIMFSVLYKFNTKKK